MLSDFASIVKSTSIDGQIMPGYRSRQKASSNNLQKPSISTSNAKQSNNPNESEAFDASDELLDNLVRNAALTTTKDVMKQRKLARYAQRQSLRRTLQINLNEEERAEVFGAGKN